MAFAWANISVASWRMVGEVDIVFFELVGYGSEGNYPRDMTG